MKRLADAEELNLVPVLNLVTILIPFLLMAAQYVSLAVIDTSLPAIGDGAPTEPGLQLSLSIGPDGFDIRARDGLAADVVGVEDGRIRLPCARGCTESADYDLDGLGRALVAVKDRHPDVEEIIVVPDADVSYELLVRSLDVARARRERDLFPRVVVAGGW